MYAQLMLIHTLYTTHAHKHIICRHQHCAMVMICHYIIPNTGLQIRYAKNDEENPLVPPRNTHTATTVLHLSAFIYSVRQVINGELLTPPSLPPNNWRNELCLYAQNPYTKTARTNITL